MRKMSTAHIAGTGTLTPGMIGKLVPDAPKSTHPTPTSNPGNKHTLMSTTLITGLQGFVYIEDFTNAINSSNNYFMLEQKDENKNIMAMPKRGVCTDARAGLYDITIIEPSFASSSSSSSSSEQINVDDSEPKRRKLNNEGTDFGGGKKRKTRKTKTRKTRKTKTRKTKKTKTRKTKRRYH
jgi:hypothetical protein